MAPHQPIFPLWPVAFATGIAAYFSAPFEPPMTALILAALGGGIALVLILGRIPYRARWAGIVVALMLAGAVWAGLRAHLVAAPVLEKRLYSTVEGRIVFIDRSATDAPRVTLADLRLPNRPVSRTPVRLRVALHGDQPPLPPPGTRIAVTAHLSPPQAPAIPGGFDFRRHAWFQQLGAVGYARDPFRVVAPSPGGWSLMAFRLRLADGLVDRLGPGLGGVAAAIVTGYRGHLQGDVVEDLRAANLSHLLAISGLHMGLLAASIFVLIRGGLALIPALALRVPGKKIAAVCALCAATGYLAMSGAGIATQRAYVMVAVMLGGVLVDRPVLSLRSVALAALIVMGLRPDAVLNVGFHMSFAATTALVVAFGAVQTLGPDSQWARLPPALRGAGAVALSSLVAGLATAPFAAIAFHRLAPYGFVANLVAVPVMGSVVMPGVILAGLGHLVGAAGPGLWMMETGLRWIVFVADHVAGWPNAVTALAAPGPAVLPMIALSGLWVLLRVGRARWIGLAGLVLAAGVWASTPRPVALIADGGGLVALRMEGALSLSHPKASGFVARKWLAADGDRRAQHRATTGWDEVAPYALRAGTGAAVYWHLRGKTGAKHGPAACQPGHVVVLSRFMRDPGTGCVWIDRGVLARRGALVRMPDGRWAGARDGPRRLWTDPDQ